jgi:hypothetical protein
VQGLYSIRDPYFLWDLVASANFMRLSLRKGAHPVLSSAASQEIRATRTMMVAMRKPRRETGFSAEDRIFPVKRRKALPYAFVLEALAPLAIETRSMFGCLAVYVGDKIVLLLRDRPKGTADNGLWLATTEEHHDSLRRDFPHMRSIQLFGRQVTGWQVLPADAPDFEQAALLACELIVARDPRIGKVPKSRQKSAKPGKF